MKKLFILLTAIVSFSFVDKATAQSFSTTSDTAFYTYSTPGTLQSIHNNITALGSNAKIDWKVVATNFPSDWAAASGLGICDNNLCYNFPGLWPAGTLKTSDVYTAGVEGDFHLQFGLPSTATTGTYYVTVKLANHDNTNDSSKITFMMTYNSASVANVNSYLSDISIYPNPASNDINVVFDSRADIKSVAIYNIIGKMTGNYRINGNSANLNLENMPSGVYFLRLMNSRGEVAATRKFTKQ